ncbi:hypothetical protein F5B22DRAFT_624395 [Xylaria bambusicola]|uniref:uncharacterized protein n=1 Tax=Xylaria bambusicola TaxID=326684 RepID=UPI00200774AD|nr:uncharacterized protein F5B22DRAFT_624395 [Xylaria bambusicola]KAI0506309.1 hypothetical protein F5B22DRAFT_624395 [Xylaria bambusicola]
MSANPDLSLPMEAPSSLAQYRAQQSASYNPTALYTLVDMTDDELADFKRECEAACVETGSERGSCVRLAPQARFVGQPLRAVFDYHLELAKQITYESEYFIAAVDKDWRARGVILVTLNDDNDLWRVQSYRTKAADAGLTVINLQIGNTGWDEERDSCEISPDSDDEDDANNDSNDNDNNDNQDADDDNDDGPPAPVKNIPLGYYIPIYIHSGLSEEKVVEKLEPAFRHKSPEDYACRIQARLTPTSPEFNTTATDGLIQKAVTLHPLRCSKNKYLQKAYILVIDTPDPVENGMLMVKVPPWDSDATKKTDVLKIGEQLARTNIENIRIPYSCHDGLQTRFLILCNGDADWPSPDVRAQPVFVAFQYGTHGKDLGFGWNLMDPRASKRKPGEERLVYTPEQVKPRPSGRGMERIEWNFNEAVKYFPWFCVQKRFIEGLDTTFFICVEGDDAAETGVLLVRRKWDGNLWGRTRDELLSLPIEGARGAVVPIKDALGLLEKGRKGDTEGMSDGLKEFFS